MEEMENICKKMWLKNVAIKTFYTIGVKSKNNPAYSNNNPVKWEYLSGSAVPKS